jgi:DNA polymerase-3 subunit beta
MKLIVSQAQLAHGLGLVSRAVSPRSTLPVLGNILIATDVCGSLPPILNLVSPAG